MDIYRTTPKEFDSINILGRVVTLLKCQDYFMGEVRYFWRADCRSITIASLCMTKAECIKEARNYLKLNAPGD